MKGVVFAEFLSFVERDNGADMVDAIIEDCRDALSTGGAYTTVGTYPCAEMEHLLGALSARTQSPGDALLRQFGEALADVFAETYPQYFELAGCLFDFVSHIDTYIHVEVRKLYPDAELPTFEVTGRSQTHLSVIYRSPRELHDLAAGLIIASARYFKETIALSMEQTGVPGETRFLIERTLPHVRRPKNRPESASAKAGPRTQCPYSS